MHPSSYALILLLGALNGVLLAVLLWRQRANRTANRLLALLVLAVSLRLAPYILGYAGQYDAHRWLTFAPFDLSLAFGPLLWGYIVALTSGSAPPRYGRHLAAPAAQLAYQLCCFVLPTDAKWEWYTGAHLHIVEPLGLALALLSLAIYLSAAARTLADYRGWLLTSLSTVEPYSLDWLRNILIAASATLLIATGFALASWTIVPLDYFQRFPMLLALAALAYLLGALGWRNALTVYPHPEVASITVDDVVAVPSEPRSSPSGYETQAARWEQLVSDAGLWRDDTLTAARLADFLDTSPRTLSRVLGEGKGVTFHAFINRMRVDAVAKSLLDASDARDITTIAFDSGFSSKATFNRAFREHYGMSPSAYRVAEQARRG